LHQIVERPDASFPTVDLCAGWWVHRVPPLGTAAELARLARTNGVDAVVADGARQAAMVRWAELPVIEVDDLRAWLANPVRPVQPSAATDGPTSTVPSRATLSST
jgi:hypothetical protein